jgi:hypothetical protein
MVKPITLPDDLARFGKSHVAVANVCAEFDKGSPNER